MAAVAMWSAYGLVQHVQMLRLLDQAQKIALVDGLKEQIEDVVARPGATKAGADSIKPLVKLLAATQVLEAQKLLAAWAKDAANTEIRLEALSGLIESGAPDGVAQVIDIYQKNLARDQELQAAAGAGRTTEEGMAAHRLMGYAFAALLRSAAPEAVAFVNQEAAKPGYAKSLMMMQGLQGRQPVEEGGRRRDPAEVN